MIENDGRYLLSCLNALRQLYTGATLFAVVSSCECHIPALGYGAERRMHSRRF